MKTRLLIIIAVFLVMIPWIRVLEFDINNQVMVDGITISSIVVMTLAVVFSLVSWVLFSWASKNIKSIGIPLSIITGISLLIPFSQVLGPMAGIIVGIVAGFTAFMLQKKITHPAQNTSLIIAAITIVITYFVLILMILAIQTPSHVWNIGDGIGAWTGTVEGMEEKGFDNIFNNNIGFSYFLALIPSLIITGLIIQGNTTKSKFLIITGSIFIVSVLLYVFVMNSMGQCDLPLIFCTNFYESNLGGGSIDLDPDLSPSYALDFAGGLFYHTFLQFLALFVIISSLFLVPYFILKRKNIPSRPYMVLILSGILLHYGITSLIPFGNNVPTLLYMLDNDQSFFIQLILPQFLIPIIVLIIAGILLYRSPVIRKLIKK